MTEYAVQFALTRVLSLCCALGLCWLLGVTFHWWFVPVGLVIGTIHGIVSDRRRGYWS